MTNEAIGAMAPPPAGDRVLAAGSRSTYGARAWALLRSRVPDVLLLGLVVGALEMLRFLPLLSAASAPVALFLLQVGVMSTVNIALVVAGATLAQAGRQRGWRRVATMVAGAWSGVAVGLVFSVWLTVVVGWNFAVTDGLIASLASYLMYIGWENAAIGAAVALFYAAREREASLARSAREAELARSEIARSMMESHLDVLRARVEPDFLFGALAEVRALYASDRVAAESLIDALIAYLRAALPQMRGGGSTVAREVELARAYVAVLQVPRGDRLAVEVEVAEVAQDLALPGMVLLPIAQAAFAAGDAKARRRFAIVAGASAGEMTIDIEVDGGVRPYAWREGEPEAVRQTLQASFGDEARLDFATDGVRHRATLRLPASAIAAPRGPAAQGPALAERKSGPGSIV